MTKNDKALMVQGDIMLQTMFDGTVFDQLQRAATLYSKSGLVPKSFEGNTAACFVGLQLAAQLGVNPFMLFQRLYNVGGKIGIEAQMAIGIANTRGVFDGSIKYTFTGKGTTRSCTATAKLAKSGEEVSVTIDWQTVEAEGWSKRSGSKWLTMPDQMFRYRTATWLIRTYAPEVLLGLSTQDELQDVIDVTPAKTIAEALAEIAEPAANNAPATPVEAEVVTEPAGNESEAIQAEVAGNELDTVQAEIDSFNLVQGALNAYTMRALKKNKSRDTWSVEDAKAVLANIQESKGKEVKK